MSKTSVAEMECPACGAFLRFDPAKGDMVCDFCETRVKIGDTVEAEEDIPEEGVKRGEPEEESGEPEAKPGTAAEKSGEPEAKPGTAAEKPGEPEEASREAAPREEAANPEEETGKTEKKKEKNTLEGFDFASIKDTALQEDTENLPIYNCASCGAELIAPASQISLACPYCGNNIVLTEKVSGKLRPNGIIPFRITPEYLPNAMKKFYKDKILLPKDFFSQSRMSRVNGVYVPFWIFSGKLSGQLTFSGEKSSTHREGDYQVTETSFYNLPRDVSMEFRDVPVDVSGKIDDALMDSLEPFDLEEKADFDMRYLAGFTSERFDQAKKTIENRAKKRMFATAEDAARSEAGKGYSNVKYSGGKLKAELTAKYLLLPVYMFSLDYEGKDYKFAVNGQTGKVVGNIPTDKMRSRLFFLKRFGIVAALIIGVFALKYLTGN